MMRHQVKAPPNGCPLLFPALREGIIDAPKTSVLLKILVNLEKNDLYSILNIIFNKFKLFIINIIILNYINLISYII